MRPCLTVLIADDDDDTLATVSRALENICERIDLAHDGATALELARARPYDLIVVDLMMPKRDGLEVLRVLAEEHRLGQTVSALMTAQSDAMRDCTDITPKPNLFLRKPIGTAELEALRVFAQSILWRRGRASQEQ